VKFLKGEKMLRLVQDKEDALVVATELKELEDLDGFSVGIAGSFARNSNKKRSAIDIVLELNDNEKKEKVGSFSLIAIIRNYVSENFVNPCEVKFLDLLEDDYQDTLRKNKDLSVNENPNNPYLKVLDEVVWAD
jgi:predicted nucleotidyltransferase